MASWRHGIRLRDIALRSGQPLGQRGYFAAAQNPAEVIQAGVFDGILGRLSHQSITGIRGRFGFIEAGRLFVFRAPL